MVNPGNMCQNLNLQDLNLLLEFNDEKELDEYFDDFCLTK